MNEYAFHPAVALDDEANDDVDFLEPEDDPDDFYWLSEEQLFELNFRNRDEDYPTAPSWKEDSTGADFLNIDVTIDKARRSLWKQAKTEIGILRKVWKNDHPSFEELASKIFGSRSKLFHLMEEELEMDYKEYCRFLATFFTAAMVSVPAPMLFDTDLFDTTGLMVGKKEFLRIYRKIDSVGAGKDNAFWMAMEDCFNGLMKKMFLSERGNENLAVALDDDKHHFNYSKNADTYGLARCRHIKDNRFGHVCHTAGLSATGLPLCASFQREAESSSEKYASMMRCMFGSRTGEAAPNLQGITLYSDRGYWNPSLLFDRLLAWGADVVGTVARASWYPFTFQKGKVRTDSDAADDIYDRVVIPMAGYQDAFYRTLNWKNNVKIRATAYRSGTGTAVSLAMSTVHHYPVFDLNMAFPKDSKHYFSPTESQATREARAFPVVAGSLDHMTLIRNLPVYPLTSVQGDTSWFIMRKFALTSSTVDKLITARASEILPNTEAREAYEIVLAVVGRKDLLPDEVPEDRAPAAGNDSDSEAESTDGDQVDDEEEDPASVWIRRVNEDGDGKAEFLRQLNLLSDNLIRAIVAKHENSKPDANITTLRKQLDKWVNCESSAHRKYFWYNKQQLFDRLKIKDPRVKASLVQKAKPIILSKLLETEKRLQRRASFIQNGVDPNIAMGEIDNVLAQGFSAWYMKPLSEEAKKYCRAGHDMERPFLEEFHCHSTCGLTCGYKSIAVHETPLVASSEIDGALDSSDAELVYETDDDATLRVIPVELKARLSHSTFYDERNRLEANLGLAAWENGEPIYVELDAESEEFHRWIPKNKESFQLLHHVAVRNLRKGLIIVGNGKKIMFGIFVTYSDETIAAYRSVLADLFDRVLKEFYDESLDLPKSMIEKIIASEQMKSIRLNVHSFQTSYFIWKKLRIDRCLPLPLPPCNRILPYNHSHWNNQKGASDTATKLFWNCRVMTSSWGKSQTVVVSKYIQLFSVVLHRMNQVATAKSDLSFYASIHHYRNTRNRHEPYHKTLDSLRKFFIRQADDRAAAVLPATDEIRPVVEAENIDLRQRTPARTVRSNPRAPFQEHRNYVTYTGGTPGKGRAYDPLSKDDLWELDQQRLKSCKGIVYKTTVRKKCCICGSDTNFCCIGCKRWYCMCSRDKKLTNLIAKDSNRVSFLKGERPPSMLVMNFVNKDGDETSLCTAENSCFHIVHKNQISQAVAGMFVHSPSPPPLNSSSLL